MPPRHRNVYRSGDGRWVAVSGTTPRQVARVLELLGPASVDHPDEIDALVAGWIAGRDRCRVADLLEARVPATEVNDLAGVVSDEHVRAPEHRRGRRASGSLPPLPA